MKNERGRVMVTDNLENQILEQRQRLSTDSYPMSIGELTNMYRDDELVISPQFQRLYRWDIEQKSRLIESILLGIPLPSVFVATRPTGDWEVIDGLQRISTLLEFQGVLKGFNDPLVLQRTKYLPALDGRTWADGEFPLSEAQRREIKRSKVDIKIIKKESASDAKYEIFQRLNSYGSALTSQEMRNAILVEKNPSFVEWLSDLARWEPFADSVNLPDRQVREKYPEELVLRFLYLHNFKDPSQTSLKGFIQGLDDASVGFAENFDSSGRLMNEIFTQTFKVIYKTGGFDLFRKYDKVKGKFLGGFSNTAFEVIAMGLGYNIANKNKYRTDLINCAKELWGEIGSRQFATGKSTEQRMSLTLPLGRELTVL